MHQRSHLGSYGENVIADLIQKQGFTILARNYRRFNGEIDLIAMQDNLLVFIEVKTRQKRYFDLSLVITPSKQRKIIAVAKNYMATHNHHASACSYGNTSNNDS